MFTLEKGHRFGLDLVLVWCCFGVVLVSIWRRFGLGLDLNWVIFDMLHIESKAPPNHKFHLNCGNLVLKSFWSWIGAGLESIWFWPGIGFGFAKARPFSNVDLFISKELHATTTHRVAKSQHSVLKYFMHIHKSHEL